MVLPAALGCAVGVAESDTPFAGSAAGDNAGGTSGSSDGGTSEGGVGKTDAGAGQDGDPPDPNPDPNPIPDPDPPDSGSGTGGSSDGNPDPDSGGSTSGAAVGGSSTGAGAGDGNPGGAAMYEPCDVDADCADGVCLTVNLGTEQSKWCTAVCADATLDCDTTPGAGAPGCITSDEGVDVCAVGCGSPSGCPVGMQCASVSGLPYCV